MTFEHGLVKYLRFHRCSKFQCVALSLSDTENAVQSFASWSPVLGLTLRKLDPHIWRPYPLVPLQAI